jgi:hypothetical protein
MLTTDADEDKVQEDEDEDEHDDSWLKQINYCIQKVDAGKTERIMHRMQTVSPEDIDIYSQEGNHHLIQDGENLVEESTDMWNIAK